MFKILLLLILAGEGGEAAVIEGPNAVTFQTKEECDAKIADEVSAAQLIIDSDLRIEKGSLTVQGGRCFSLGDIMKLRGEKEAHT